MNGDRQTWSITKRGSSLATLRRDVARDQVGRELGVRYMVQGSVRQTGERLRVAVELSDVANATRPA